MPTEQDALLGDSSINSHSGPEAVSTFPSMEGIILFPHLGLGLPWWLSGKESACNVGDLGSIPGLGRSPEGGPGNLLQYSCLKNPHGQRSLVSYSPWVHNKSDMIKATYHALTHAPWS